MSDNDDKQLWQNTLTKLKAKCKQDGVPFSLTIQDVIKVLDNKCAYTGQLLFRKNGSGSGWQPNTPTLTMVDGKLGFVPGNVKVVSNLTATLLNNLTVDQLSNLVKAITPVVDEVPLMQQLDELSTRVFDAATIEKECEEIIEALEVKFTRRSKALRQSLK
jgi:hypothetical protein